MKKKVCASVIAVMMLASIAGCGSKYDNNSMSLSKIDVDKYVTSLGEYKGIEVTTTPKEEVNENTVNSYIQYLLGSQTTSEKSDKDTVENGDIANIDYVGKKDDVAFDGGTAQGYDLAIGSGTFIPGFEEGLVGAKVGETRSLNLTFPENYGNEELAGAAVVFDVTVNYISVNKTPELTDEFVTGLAIDGVTTVDAFKTYVEDSLKTNADSVYKSTLQDNAMSVIIDKCTFSDEYPQMLFDYYLDTIKQADTKKASGYGVDLESYVTGYYGISMEEYNTQLEDQAKLMIKDALVCEAIARIEKISVTDEEFNEQLSKDATAMGYDSVDAFKAAISEDDYRNYLLEVKVMDYVLESATITDSADVQTIQEEETTPQASESAEE